MLRISSWHNLYIPYVCSKKSSGLSEQLQMYWIFSMPFSCFLITYIIDSSLLWQKSWIWSEKHFRSWGYWLTSGSRLMMMYFTVCPLCAAAVLLVECLLGFHKNTQTKMFLTAKNFQYLDVEKYCISRWFTQPCYMNSAKRLFLTPD